ncbi:uncharacterized protein LOC141858512 [Brevipalpus obovatus]|uniref:uncharacterized protein LOC141858512 n=1 Tax=Brevipalpus obovatus TaxID=246614 RepID=UPI003D9DF676
MKLFFCFTLIIAMVHLGSSQMPCKEQITECVSAAKEAYAKLVKKICEKKKKILVEELKPTTSKHMTASGCEKITQAAVGSFMEDSDIGSDQCLNKKDQQKMKSFADPSMKKICKKCIEPMPKKHAKVDLCKNNDNTIMDDMKQCIIGEMMPAMLSAKGAADAVGNMCKTDKCKAKLAKSCGNIIEAEAAKFNPDFNDGWKPAGFPANKLSTFDNFKSVIDAVVSDFLNNIRK